MVFSDVSDGKADPFSAAVGATGACRPASGIGHRLAIAMLAMPILAMVSCVAVPASQQQRLSKANMVFDDTNAFAMSTRLLPQSEPGSASSGGAQGGGCTACK